MNLVQDQCSPLTKTEEQELRLMLAELEYRRHLNPLEFFEPLGAQEKFNNDPAKRKGLFGGNRSGKTENIAQYLIRKCQTKPKQRWWACAETFSDSVNIQQRKVAKFLPLKEVKYGSYDEVNGFANRKVLFSNGSIINFKSYDQGCMSFAQDDCDGIWNDEEPPYDIYKEQKMRLIDRDGEMLLSMTSVKGLTDLLHDIFEDHTVIESVIAPFLDEELPTIVEKDTWKFYMLWTLANPYISQDRLKQEIKFMTRDEIKSRIFGIPINLSGKIYGKFNTHIHVIPFESVPLKDVTLYMVLDPHDRKPWAMQWWAVHSTGTAYCVDEYPNRNFNEMISDDKTYDEYVTLIKEKENILFDQFGKEIYKRIIDPNFGNKTVQLAERIDSKAHTTPKEELAKRGLKFQDGIDALEAGHLKVREMIHYEKKEDEIIYQSKTFFVEGCENSIRHMSRYSRKDLTSVDGDMKDKVGVLEKYKDFCDLVRYFWMSNPKYIGQLKQFVPQHRKVY